MSNDYKDLSFSGPDKNYKAQKGSNNPASNVDIPTFDGSNYSRKTLDRQLNEIIKQTELLILSADEDLKNFNLKIETDKLMEAQKTIWPESIPEVKDYITYSQYQALDGRLDRASKYIRDQYLNNIRSEKGTGSLDVRKVANVLNTEATNIKGFLNAHVGNVSDAAVGRVQELLQDWATSALVHSGRLWSYFSERNKENTSQIPESEMALIEGQDAGKYQALFKAKVNAVNLELDRDLSSFEKHFSTSSDLFYNKFLGPSIRFRINAGKNLELKANDNTVLGTEIKKAVESLRINTQAGLTDLLERNQIFSVKMNKIEDTIGRRESLKGVINHLSSKSNVSYTPFVNGQPDIITDKALAEALSGSGQFDEFSSTHGTLAGREAKDAHPQYLLKAGDTITGDILFDDGIKIDGVDLSEHAHTGEDGSQKISGRSIMDGTLISDTVDVSEHITKPLNLRILNQFEDGGTFGSTTFLGANLFWESKDQNQMYEIQIVQRDSATPVY